MNTKRLFPLFLGAVLFTFTGLAIYLWAIQERGNFATVLEGQVYRSNQVSADRLRTYRNEHGIQTVLNLRGASPGSDWYREEVAAAEELGITLVDFPLSAQKELSDAEIADLLQILQDAPKPLLIHCKSGADRTGLASLIYLTLIAGEDEDRAEWQLSLLYGHVPVPWLSQAWPMDQTWERIEEVYHIEEKSAWF